MATDQFYRANDGLPKVLWMSEQPFWTPYTRFRFSPHRQYCLPVVAHLGPQRGLALFCFSPSFFCLVPSSYDVTNSPHSSKEFAAFSFPLARQKREERNGGSLLSAHFLIFLFFFVFGRFPFTHIISRRAGRSWGVGGEGGRDLPPLFPNTPFPLSLAKHCSFSFFHVKMVTTIFYSGGRKVPERTSPPPAAVTRFVARS